MCRDGARAAAVGAGLSHADIQARTWQVLDGDVHIVPHRGMPRPQDNGTLHYGDMRVAIRVLMPKGPLSPEKKVEIFEALEGLEWRLPNPRPRPD